MTNYFDLQRAIGVAFIWHGKQKRLDGTDYIYHPLHVMLQLKHEDYTTQVVAVLHDILEDTKYTFEQMQADFGNEITEMVLQLTKPKEMSYTDYIMRISNCGYKEVINVKIADLIHNLSTIDCIRDPAKRYRLKQRYENALNILSQDIL